MVSAETFVRDLTRDLVKHYDKRPQVMAGWTKHLEAREEAIRQDTIKSMQAEQSPVDKLEKESGSEEN